MAAAKTFFLLFALSPLQAQSPAPELTVESYVRMSLEASPDVSQAVETLSQAQSQYSSQLGAALLPTLAFTGSAVPYGQDPLDSHRFHAWRLKRTETNVTTTFNWNLFNSFQDVQKLRSSSLNRTAAQRALETARQERAFAATNSFYELSSKAQLREVARQNLAAQEEQYRQTSELYRNGMKSLSDLLKGETDWRSSELRIIAATAEYKSALMQFNLLINRPAFEEVGLKTDLALGATALPLLEDDWAQALARRPEVRNARTQWERARVAAQQSLQGLLPTLSMNAVWNRSYLGPPSAVRNPNYQIGLNLSLPVNFNVVSQAYEYLAAKAENRRAAGALEAVLRRVRRETAGAYINLEKAIRSYEVSARKEAIAEKNLSLVADQYRQGSSDAIRLAQAQLDYLNAQVERTGALHDIFINRAQYRLAVGETLW